MNKTGPGKSVKDALQGQEDADQARRDDDRTYRASRGSSGGPGTDDPVRELMDLMRRIDWTRHSERIEPIKTLLEDVHRQQLKERREQAAQGGKTG